MAAMMRGSELVHESLPVDELADGFAAVAEGTADAAVSNSYFAGRNAAAYGLRETAIVFNPAALYFAVPRGRHAGLLQQIDRHLLSWRQDSESVYFDVMRRAMAPPPASTRLSSSQRIALVVLLGLVLAAIVFGAVMRWQVRHRTLELARTSERLEHLLAASPVVLYLQRIDGDAPGPRWASSNLQRLFGLDPAQVADTATWLGHVHPDDRERVAAAFAALPRRGQLAEEYRITDGRGALRQLRDEARWVSPGDGGRAEIVGSWSDLTEAHAHQARLDFLARHDSLTGLPNRVALNDGLQQAIGEAATAHRQFALALLNVDRLHRVNDGFGHDAGDALLCELARRLQGELQRGETLARLGSDEFAVLLGGHDDPDDAVARVGRLLAEVSRPFRYQDHSLTVTASIGIALYPENGSCPGDLLKSADTALAGAKQAGRNGFSFATTQMNAQVQRWVAIEHQLREAIEQQQFHLHYQPRASLADGHICGAEALIRWNSPVLGPVPPSDFIPVAEDIGLIGAIGEWVLRSACAQNRAWQQQGLPPMRVAVNVSAQQLTAGDLPALVRRVLADVGLAAEWLEIELTESVMMDDSDGVLEQLAELNRLGVSVSLDDFGTGYSSLGYLSRFDLDSLKIDQGFVRDITVDRKSAAIAKATIGLAHGLGIKVVAEGVETEAQLQHLRSIDCDEMQGYLLSRPLPPRQLAEMMDAGRPVMAW